MTQTNSNTIKSLTKSNKFNTYSYGIISLLSLFTISLCLVWVHYTSILLEPYPATATYLFIVAPLSILSLIFLFISSKENGKLSILRGEKLFGNKIKDTAGINKWDLISFGITIVFFIELIIMTPPAISFVFNELAFSKNFPNSSWIICPVAYFLSFIGIALCYALDYTARKSVELEIAQKNLYGVEE